MRDLECRVATRDREGIHVLGIRPDGCLLSPLSIRQKLMRGMTYTSCTDDLSEKHESKIWRHCSVVLNVALSFSPVCVLKNGQTRSAKCLYILAMTSDLTPVLLT